MGKYRQGDQQPQGRLGAKTNRDGQAVDQALGRNPDQRAPTYGVRFALGFVAGVDQNQLFEQIDRDGS